MISPGDPYTRLRLMHLAIFTFSQFFPLRVLREKTFVYLYLTAPELLLKRKQGELKHFTDGAESKGMFVLISDTPPSELFRSVKELKSLWKMETL